MIRVKKFFNLQNDQKKICESFCYRVSMPKKDKNKECILFFSGLACTAIFRFSYMSAKLLEVHL